jgi:hypothetical protein
MLVFLAVHARLAALGVDVARFGDRVDQRVAKESLWFAETLPWGDATAAKWRDHLQRLDADRADRQ